MGGFFRLKWGVVVSDSFRSPARWRYGRFFLYPRRCAEREGVGNGPAGVLCVWFLVFFLVVCRSALLDYPLQRPMASCQYPTRRRCPRCLCSAAPTGLYPIGSTAFEVNTNPNDSIQNKTKHNAEKKNESNPPLPVAFLASHDAPPSLPQPAPSLASTETAHKLAPPILPFTEKQARQSKAVESAPAALRYAALSSRRPRSGTRLLRVRILRECESAWRGLARGGIVCFTLGRSRNIMVFLTLLTLHYQCTSKLKTCFQDRA